MGSAHDDTLYYAQEAERRKMRLSPKCTEMLAAVKAAGECMRMVRGRRADKWVVGDRRFHAFTGDALARRGLLQHFVLDEYDGNSFDRYKPQ